jgi:hypothetical protein
MLTKSLHTVTAVTNVARLLVRHDSSFKYRSIDAVLSDALGVLGYRMADFDADDTTVAACRKSITKSFGA